MFSEFNSWLFYLGTFSISAYMLGFIKENQERKTFFYILITMCALAIPTLVAAYRVCGTDIFTYMQIYKRISITSWADIFESTTSIFESGHRLLTKFLGLFHNVRVYLGVYAAITILFVYFATKQYKAESTPMVMFLYYFLFFANSFNGMRQNFAAVIVAYSLKYVFSREFTKFILMMLLAAMFHTSSIFLIFIYFLWNKNEKLLPWPLLLLILAVATIISLNLDSFLETFSNYEFEDKSFQRYLNYNKDFHDTKNRDFYVKLLISVIVMWHYTRLVKVDKKNAFFSFLIYIGTILGLCGFISPSAKRISLYFDIATIWVLADIPKCYKDHVSVWATRLLVILYAVLMFTITAYILGQSTLIPYMWILPSWAR